MNQLFSVLLFFTTAALFFCGTLFGQETAPCGLCFKGKPKPDCCSFLISETGFLLGGPISGAPLDKENYLFTGDFGVMFNRVSSSALGGALHVAMNQNCIRFGAGPRYRKWLNKTLALDISPKALIFGFDDSQINRRYPGFVMAVSLSANDLVSFDTYFQMFPYEANVYDYNTSNFNLVRETETGIYFGFSGRSYLAPVIPVIVGSLVAVFYALAPND